MISVDREGTSMDGEIYFRGLDLLARRRSEMAVKDEILFTAAQDQTAAFRTGWPDFQLAAWVWLWENKEKTVFKVTVFGLTLFSRTWGDLRKLWRTPFGPCPFDWGAGP